MLVYCSATMLMLQAGYVHGPLNNSSLTNELQLKHPPHQVHPAQISIMLLEMLVHPEVVNQVHGTRCLAQGGAAAHAPFITMMQTAGEPCPVIVISSPSTAMQPGPPAAVASQQRCDSK